MTDEDFDEFAGEMVDRAEEGLEKEAGRMGDFFGTPVGQAMAASGGAAVMSGIVGTGIAVGQDLYSKAKDSLTRARDYRAMMKANPHLKDIDAHRLRRAHHTVRKLMPSMAGDPILSGELVGNLAQRETWGTEPLKNMVEMQRTFTQGRPRAESAFGQAMLGSLQATGAQAGQEAAQAFLGTGDHDPARAADMARRGVKTDLDIDRLQEERRWGFPHVESTVASAEAARAKAQAARAEQAKHQEEQMMWADRRQRENEQSDYQPGEIL